MTLTGISAIVRDTGALEAARETTREEAARGIEALKAIPGKRYRDALELIINYTVERNK